MLEELALKYELPQRIIDYREIPKLKTLCRCAPQADRSAYWPGAHDFESGRLGNRTVVVDKS
jgi:hypothetical protein